MKITQAPRIDNLVKAQHGFIPSFAATCGATLGQNKQIGCGAVLELDTTDLFTRTYGPPMMGNKTINFRCPCCHAINFINPGHIPQNISLPDFDSFMAKAFTTLRHQLLSLYQDDPIARAAIEDEFPDLDN